MSFLNQRSSLLRTLILLTILFIVAQISIATIAFYVKGILGIAQSFLTPKVIFSQIIFFPLLQVILAQLVIYASLVYCVWYVATSTGELCAFRPANTYYFGILLWLNTVLAILVLHTYYVPHSLFTYVIRHDFFHNLLTNHWLKIIFIITASLGLISVGLAFINSYLCVRKRQHVLRSGIMLGFVVLVLGILKGEDFFGRSNLSAVASASPNVFIVSFDAVRPDYLSYFNKQRTLTPNFDEFLRSSVVFTEAFTPLARTQPSWAAILTSQYPLHSGVRENNMRMTSLYLQETLPKILQQAGYETIYATDDRRFNTIDTHFGFDSLIGPDGTAADYLIGTINDFPLSNLLVSTKIGKLLFPYNYANHGATYSFDPDNFLELINHALQHRSNKPLFFAVHFDLSGWPFYWLNDDLAYDANDVAAYANSIHGDDILLQKFLTLLAHHQLLKHAIVVLISDHGITLGLHGDRTTTEELYQGNRADMKVTRARYSDGEAIGLGSQPLQIKGMKLNFNKKDFGIDTSYNYGGDVLSLKQFQPVLAFRSYGMSLSKPHHVDGRSMLIDIAPTLLDILHLSSLLHADGISLKPYLLDISRHVNERTIYLESGFSVAELEQNNIIAAKVAAKSIAYFQLNLANGALTLNTAYLDLLVDQKQRAILQGDWLLSYYPTSIRYKMDPVKGLVTFLMPPYSVLINVKTGKWATDTNTFFVAHSPMAILKQRLFNFYGREMENYKKMQD